MKKNIAAQELELELLEQAEYTQKVKQIILDRYLHMPMAHVHSYGCKQNVTDGEKIKGMLAQMGYGFTDDTYDADLIIYNTCAVRENAEDKVFGNVGELKHNKERKRNTIIGLCGCMIQQPHIVDKIKKSYPHVDLVFGTHVIHTLPEMLYQKLTTLNRIFSTKERDGAIVEGIPVRRDETVKAWVPIMNGCDNYCTYCIVPYVRGTERSRDCDVVIEEIQQLVADGFKEITLIGQNVNSYGKGLKSKTSFSDLLRKINLISGDFRVRFLTSHPKDCTKQLIDTIAQCDKICNHIHLPVQSGSNRILKLMNRNYTQKSYIELIDYAKTKIDDVAFSSDIIVGFPGETYEDFEQTLQLVQAVEYNALFTFIYSKRQGTKAADLPDTTPEAQKSIWFQQLLDIQKPIARKKHDALVGKTVRILVDGQSKTSAEYLTGRTDTNFIVNFVGNDSLIGTFVNVKVTQALSWAVVGELVINL